MLSKEKVDALVYRARMGDEYYGYKDSSDLAVLMILLYYGPMKMVDAMHLTPAGLKTGTYVSKQKGTVTFTLPEEQLEYISPIKEMLRASACSVFSLLTAGLEGDILLASRFAVELPTRSTFFISLYYYLQCTRYWCFRGSLGGALKESDAETFFLTGFF